MKIRQSLAWAQPSRGATVLLAIVSVSLFLRNRQDFRAGGIVPQDFRAYLRGLAQFRQGLSPYILADPLPYKYSPGFLVPLSLLPENPNHAWFIAKILLVLCWLLAIVWGARFKKWEDVALLVAGLALSWKGLIEALDFGQIEFLYLLLAVVAARLLRRKPFWSGLSVGVLPWIKLPWGLLGLPFLLLSFFGGALLPWCAGAVTGFALMGAVLPLLAFGFSKTPAYYRDWFKILKIQPRGVYTGDYNQSLWGLATRWLPEGSVPLKLAELLIMGFAAAFTAYLCIETLRRFGLKYKPTRKTSSKEISGGPVPLAWLSPWLIFDYFVNPLGWRWASLLVVGFPWTREFSEWKKKPALLAAISACLLLQLNPVVHLFGFPHWTDLHPYGSITLYWALLLSTV